MNDTTSQFEMEIILLQSLPRHNMFHQHKAPAVQASGHHHCTLWPSSCNNKRIITETTGKLINTFYYVFTHLKSQKTLDMSTTKSAISFKSCQTHTYQSFPFNTATKSNCSLSLSSTGHVGSCLVSWRCPILCICTSLHACTPMFFCMNAHGGRRCVLPLGRNRNAHESVYLTVGSANALTKMKESMYRDI